jgi:cysteine synthase
VGHVVELKRIAVVIVAVAEQVLETGRTVVADAAVGNIAVALAAVVVE